MAETQQPPQPQTPAATATGQRRLPINTYHCRFCSHLLLATTRRIDTLPRRKGANQYEQDSGSGGGLDRAIILPLTEKWKQSRSRSVEPGENEDEDEEDDDYDEGKEDQDQREDKIRDNTDDGGSKNKDENSNEEEVEEKEKGNDNEDAERTNKGNENESDKDNHIDIDHVTILLSTILPNSFRSIIRRGDGFEKRIFLRCGRCHVFIGYFLDAVHFPLQNTSNSDDNTDADGEPTVVYILPGALVESHVLAESDEGKLAAKDGEWKEWFRYNGNAQLNE